MVLKFKQTFTSIFTLTFLALGVSAQGIVWNEDDLKLWRDRAVNGPYVEDGDSYDPLVPGEWNRIVSEKESFMKDPDAERKSSIVRDSGSGYINNHKELLGAAFYALVKDDDAVKEAVKTEILWHARQSALQISKTDLLETDLGNWWQCAWLGRMLMATDFVKDAFSTSEMNEVNAWMENWAYMYEAAVHSELINWLFTYRYDRDYSRGGSYVFNTKSDNYAYKDASGKHHNMIDRVHKHYNNRRSSVMQFVGLYAVWSDDALLIDRTKLYFEEWLKFSVFPDGSTGEFERNDDSGRNIQQGILYNAINLEAYVTFAEALALTGDLSMYEFTTRDGIHGTESESGEGAKSLKLVVENYLDLIEHEVAWYNADYDVSEDYRLDNVTNISQGNVAGTQWINEIWFAPMGNRYWKDQRIKDGYMRQSSGSIEYFTPFGTAGPYGGAWRGHQAVFPSILFMYAETEYASTYVAGETDTKEDTVADPVVETEEPAVVSTDTYSMLYSGTYRSSDAIELTDIEIEEPIYITINPSTDIARVQFYHSENGDEVLVHTERGAPYDYMGTNVALTPSAVPESGLSLVAVVTTNAGIEQRIEATILQPESAVPDLEEESVDIEVEPIADEPVVNDPIVEEPVVVEPVEPADENADYSLVYATSYRSSDAVVLTEASISEPIYISVYPATDISRVLFYHVDGSGVETHVHTERAAPYDYFGTAASLDPSDIPADGREIVAVVYTSDGGSQRIEVRVTVDADDEPEAVVDTDKLPDDWELEFFGGLFVENGGELEDFDGDKVSNFSEWRANTDPTDPTDFVASEQFYGVVWSSEEGKEYRIECSDDGWETVKVSAVVDGTGSDTTTWVDPESADAPTDRLYRVVDAN